MAIFHGYFDITRGYTTVSLNMVEFLKNQFVEPPEGAWPQLRPLIRFVQTSKWKGFLEMGHQHVTLIPGYFIVFQVVSMPFK